MGGFVSTPSAPKCSGPPATPCSLAFLARPYAPARSYCSSAFPQVAATTTITASSSVYTTTVATTTLTTTLTTSPLFLTLTTQDLTSTIDDGVFPTTVGTPTVPSTTTVLRTPTSTVSTAITLTVTAGSTSGMSSTATGTLISSSAGVAKRSPLIPRGGSTCRSGVSLSGCSYRTCTYRCGIDRPFGDYSRLNVSSFDACSQACASDARCQVAAYDRARGFCWLKHRITTTQANAGLDLIECAVEPSAVWSTILASGSPFVQSACSCLQTQATVTATLNPIVTLAVTATVNSQVTAVATSFGVATNLVTTRLVSTQGLTATATSVVTVTSDAPFAFTTVTSTIYSTVTPGPTIGAEKIANGGFEINGGDPHATYFPPWDSVDNMGARPLVRVWGDAHSGSAHVEMQSSRASIILTQDVSPIDITRQYNLNFWYSPMSFLPIRSGKCTFAVTIGGISVFNGAFDGADQTSNWYNSGNLTISGAQTQSGTLSFVWDCTAVVFQYYTGGYMGIDDVLFYSIS